MEMEKKSKKVKLVNPSPEKPLTNLTLSAASLARMCREIADNKHGWFWDNCKVEPAQIVAASLKSILQPYIGQLDEPAVHSAWLEAVKRTHGATVDALAINPAAYCVGCFKDQLNDAVTRTAN